MSFQQLRTGSSFWDRCAFAILLVCGVGTAILLIPTLMIWIVLFFGMFGVWSDEPPQIGPEERFLHMTAWEMPPGGQVVSIDDTFDYGWRSGGDLTLYATVPPRELTRMMALPGFHWNLWPPQENLDRSVDLPRCDATHYRIERISAQATNWHGGKIVMVNMSNGQICAHEWRH